MCDKPSNRAYALANALVSGASAAWLDGKQREAFLSMQWVTGAGANGGDWKQQVAELIRELESGHDRHDFWSYTSLMDLMWAQWMMEATLGECPTLDESIFLHRLDCALERYPDPSQLDSVRRKLETATDLLQENLAPLEGTPDAPAAPGTEAAVSATLEACAGVPALRQLLEKCLVRLEEFKERQHRPL